MTTNHFPAPRSNTADEACDDFIAFLKLAEHCPDASESLSIFFASKRPVFTCTADPVATAKAGRFRFTYSLVEGLARFLRFPPTSMQGEDAPSPDPQKVSAA